MMRRTSCGIALIAFCFCAASTLRAQITTDGSLGPKQSLSGPDIRIAPSLGQARGANLFHSFAQFNINAGQRVTFDGAAGTGRVIARVTGGSASQIQGTLASSVQGDLFLINPAGVLFGPSSSVEVSGRFVVSTADVLNFDDASAFTSVPSTNEVLTAAAPASFGFLPSNLGKINFDHAELTLGPAGFYAPSIDLDGALVGSQGPFLSFAAPASATLPFFLGEPAFPDPRVVEYGGAITMRNGAAASVVAAGLSFLSVQAKTLTMTDASNLLLINVTTTTGSGILANGSDRLTMRNRSAISTLAGSTVVGPGIVAGGRVLDMDRSSIQTISIIGPGGPIIVQATRLLMAHNANIATANNQSGDAQSGDVRVDVGELSMRRAVISTTTTPESAGSAGLLRVRARGTINLRDGSFISSVTRGTGTGGDLEILAKRGVQIRGNSGVLSDTLSPGFAPAGTVTIVSPEIVVENSIVSSSTRSRGNANVVTLTTTDTGQIVLSGSGPPTDLVAVLGGVATASVEGADFSGGNGSDVRIRTGTLIIRNGASISASTFTTGDAGNVFVDARQVFLRGNGVGIAEGLPTSINSQSEFDGADGGRAGEIRITGETLELNNKAVITSSTFSDGDGGSVNIEMGRVLVSGLDTGIGAVSGAEDDPANGAAGSVSIVARDSIELRDQATVTVTGLTSPAGNMLLDSGGDLILNQSLLEAQSGGAGANIRLAASGRILINESVVTAEAAGSGENARVVLDRARTTVVGNSLIDGQANGVDVLVQLNSPIVLLAGSTQILSDRTVIPFSQSDVTLFQALPAIGLDRNLRLSASCFDRAEGVASSFTVQGRGGIEAGAPLRFEMR